jgi:hypothetical protein
MIRASLQRHGVNYTSKSFITLTPDGRANVPVGQKQERDQDGDCELKETQI